MEMPYRLPLLLDGATTTKLLTMGVSENECLEKWILENPEKLEHLQKSYVSAGADIIYAPTCTANSESLKRFGMEKQTKEINKKLVELTKKNVGGKAMVAGNFTSIELKINHDDEEGFIAFDKYYNYLEQAEALKEAGVDIFAIEAMTSLADARMAVLACKRFSLPIFVTMEVDDDGETTDGSTALASLICLQSLGISAFGFTCEQPEDIYDTLKEIASYSKVPLIVKPGAYQEDTSYIMEPLQMAQGIIPLLENGASIIGGFNGVSAEHISEIKKTIDNFSFSDVKIEKSDEDCFILSNHRQAFFITADNLECSDPLECSIDMSDEIMEINQTNIDAITVELLSYDDAILFAENAHMTMLPIIFKSESQIALDTALFLYNGRAMIDTDCEIDEEILQDISKKYGAIIY